MPARLTQPAEVVEQHLNREFPGTFFDVRGSRRQTGTPSAVTVNWLAYPFEDHVEQALRTIGYDPRPTDGPADAAGPDSRPVAALSRVRLWSCGSLHANEMEAWKAHEGADHLEYDDPHVDPLGLNDKHLPLHVETELSENGETFTSTCREGNYVMCPTCGGGSRIPVRDRFEPCPDCVALGLDASPLYTGVLDLDVVEHRRFYDEHRRQLKEKVRRDQARQERKMARALAEATTHAQPDWHPLPTRSAGIINGIPVHTSASCDYLAPGSKDAGKKGAAEARACFSAARWFDPTTGVRVCGRHR